MNLPTNSKKSLLKMEYPNNEIECDKKCDEAEYMCENVIPCVNITSILKNYVSVVAWSVAGFKVILQNVYTTTKLSQKLCRN